ncbi:NADH-quinone oxidoreductase subunit C [Cyclonatronum proteinivorum]|uniref:NADH-quinone oxidoreductase subunit C n=1 Tax=Cyclonatronum proteinivorum TaxID=1457365 RepID=A0A345UKX5_9BACT|nr:NADH-quinone oxidoreductase subunit C [Cyclonatronum proteinivorum]AXJ01127.1 NADH-quinone oxidoreductase subunit C [Cyclonatronum proteinivorum]
MRRKELIPGIIEDLREKFGEAILETTEHAGDQITRIALGSIHDVCKYLKENHHFVYLVDMIATDRFTAEDRFEVIYHMVSLKTGARLFIRTWVSEENPVVPTVTDIWQGANWNEREAWDMFGIKFHGHPDLRRMFMPEDFQYHPLRKEFPLLGIPGSLSLPTTTPDSE